jgi:hypothetical protein
MPVNARAVVTAMAAALRREMVEVGGDAELHLGDLRRSV